MSTDELTRQLQQLTLHEARLKSQLASTTTNIESVRQQIIRASTTDTNTPTAHTIRVGDRIRICNPTKIRTPQTQQWIENEQRGTVTGITHSTRSPFEATRYQYITDNGTKTWRKAHNIQHL
jgi:hypothetical protein